MRLVTFDDTVTPQAFSEIIDVRSPAEFALDHVPGAVNLPVLSDAERAEIGTRYVRQDRLDARRLGAALVARNIATMLETHFADRPPDYHPLIYCWRGGQRSRSLAMILAAVGFQPAVLSGGYKQYRAYVREKLATLAEKIRPIIISGLTGSGKTRFLQWAGLQGIQVLDLEAIAHHRGSSLGEEINHPQPSQKQFESNLLQALLRFDPSVPVLVESESKRIGQVWCPEPLWKALTVAPVVEIAAPMAERVGFLLQEYAHFQQQPDLLRHKLRLLKATCGQALLDHWHTLISAGQWREFVASILEKHYDPAYRRVHKYRPPTAVLSLSEIGPAGFAPLLEKLRHIIETTSL